MVENEEASTRGRQLGVSPFTHHLLITLEKVNMYPNAGAPQQHQQNQQQNQQQRLYMEQQHQQQQQQRHMEQLQQHQHQQHHQQQQHRHNMEHQQHIEQRRHSQLTPSPTYNMNNQSSMSPMEQNNSWREVPDNNNAGRSVSPTDNSDTEVVPSVADDIYYGFGVLTGVTKDDIERIKQHYVQRHE